MKINTTKHATHTSYTPNSAQKAVTEIRTATTSSRRTDLRYTVSAGSSKQETTKLSRKNAPVQPQVFYTSEAWHTIKYLVAACDVEIGWLGLVETLETGDFLITDIYVPTQEVTGATTEIENDAVSRLAYQLMDENKDPSKLIYWGHSHVNMGVTPSGQDEYQLAEYLEDCPVFIRGIYNKRGESKVDVVLRDEDVIHQCVTNRPLHDLIDPDLKSALDAVMKANVKKRTYQNYGNSTWHNKYDNKSPSANTGYTRDLTTGVATPKQGYLAALDDNDWTYGYDYRSL